MELLKINDELYDRLLEEDIDISEDQEGLLWLLSAYMSEAGKIMALGDELQILFIKRRIQETYKQLQSLGYELEEVEKYES